MSGEICVNLRSYLRESLWIGLLLRVRKALSMKYHQGAEVGYLSGGDGTR